MNTFTKHLLAAGLVTLGSRAASAQVLYDNFENTRLITYGYVSGALAPVANPGSSSTNSSATVGKYDRDASQYAVVVFNPTSAKMADVSAYSAGTKKLSMKFRSPGPGTVVQLVLQNKAKAAVNAYPLGDYAGTFSATTTAAANTWETLTFTFGARDNDATVTATMVDQLVMLVAPNTTTAATYYLDDVMGPELTATTPAPVATKVLLDNFENTRLVDYPTPQGTLTVVANPGSSTANNSASSASFVRDGSQYATLSIALKNGGKFADVTPFISGTQTISVKFRSARPAGTAVQLVLQNRAKAIATPYAYPQGNYLGTFDAVTTAAANTWETLTFKFNAGATDASIKATDIDQLAMLIAPNSTSTDTYYLDDLMGPSVAGTVTATRTSQTTAAALATAYPNPSLGLTHLPYSLQKPAVVSLALYDAMGRRVASVLDNQAKPAGDYTADLRTSSLAPGLYTCRLVVDGVALTRALSVE